MVVFSQRWQGWCFLGLPLLLVVLCLWSQPFSKVVASKTLSTRILSMRQLTNLRVAAKKLDGLVLQPGEALSFNKVVGPRTVARGYLEAPSYLGGESPATVGGGLCLLSSALYQLALESGLSIQQRHPHLRTIHSVPPGLDATVWYGSADLQMANTLSFPVRLQVMVQSGVVAVSFQGAHALKTSEIHRLVHRRNARELLVTVWRGREMISRDLYRLLP